MSALRSTTDHRRPAGVAIWVIGILLVAFGVLGLLTGGGDFSAEPFDGDVTGDLLLGVEANGWTNALFVLNGVLLILASASRFSTRFVAVAVSLDFATAAVAGYVGGSDILGIFAINAATRGVWLAAALLLFIVALTAGAARSPAGHPA